MGVMSAAGLGALVCLGLVLIGAGLLRREPSTELSPGLWRKLPGVFESWSRRRRIHVMVSLAAAVIVAVATGWLIALVLIPLALIGIPTLLSEPPQREVDLLAGLDRWVRILGPSIATGKSIRDAIIATRRQAPEILAEPVARVVARLDQGWSTRDALLAMADEVASADGDAVLSALAIASSRGGAGTRATLTALADNTQQRLRVLREIASERAKPRAVVRQVTLITMAILGGSLLLGGAFFDPYRTPLGQLIALALAAAYFGALVMLRRRTTPPPTPRFLRAES